MLLDSENCLLVIVDLQSKLMSAMPTAKSTIQHTYALAKAAQLLGVPVIITEHYAHKIGSTVSELEGLTGTLVHKTTFSAWREPSFQTWLSSTRRNILFCGAETHVCVLQSLIETAQALPDSTCYLVTDACASRKRSDFERALNRIEMHGGELISTEMVLFEWLKHGDHPHFKEIIQLVKNLV